MALDPKLKSGEVGPDSRSPGTASGSSPTKEIGPDATLEFSAKGDAKPEPAVTTSLHWPAEGQSIETDNLDRTSTFGPGNKGMKTAEIGKTPISRTIGPYAIERELGRGGMGVVYLARHEQLGRTVALKMILAGTQAGEEAQKRFLLEAQSIARLSHPGIVTVYDIGEYEGMPYFSLEYVAGNSLAKLLAEKPLEPRAAASLVAKMAAAMQYAHEKGVVHRDLKPNNVLMADGETPKITDFGLAKQLEGAQDAELTQSGTILGTPSYMSPEQATGELHAVGPPADQYSLGAILYQMLTGRAPFVASRPFDVIRQVLEDEPVPPKKLVPTVPAELETICLKAMHKDAARRYADCRELADDLARFMDGRPILARPVSQAERLVRWCRRNPVVASTSGLAAAALLTLLAVVSWSSYSLAQKNATILVANSDLQDANTKLGQQNILLEQRRQQAEAASKLAYERTQLASNSFRFLIDKARGLSVIPQLRDFGKDLVLTAADGLEQLPDDPDNPGTAGLEKAKGEEYFYATYLDYGEPSKAIPHIENCLAILRDRNSRQGTDATRFNLAACLRAKAQARQTVQRDIPLCLALCDESIGLLESILKTPLPAEFDETKGSRAERDVRQLLLSVRNVQTSLLWQQGRITQTLAQARENARILNETFARLPELKDLTPEQQRNVRSGMSRLYQIHSVAALRAGELKEAAEQQQEALELAQLAVQNSQGGWDARLAKAELLGFAGDLYLAQKDEAKALAAYEEAAEMGRKLLSEDQTSEPCRIAVNVLLIRLAGFEKSRDAEQARKLYDEAVGIARQMVMLDPEGRAKQVALALSLAPTGAHAEASGIADKLLAEQTNPDAELLVDMARVYAQCSVAEGLEAAKATEFQALALDCLRKAKDQGYRDHFYLTFHPDFAPLQAEQPMLELLKEIKPIQ